MDLGPHTLTFNLGSWAFDLGSRTSSLGRHTLYLSLGPRVLNLGSQILVSGFELWAWVFDPGPLTQSLGSRVLGLELGLLNLTSRTSRIGPLLGSWTSTRGPDFMSRILDFRFRSGVSKSRPGPVVSAPGGTIVRQSEGETGPGFRSHYPISVYTFARRPLLH